MWIYQQNSEIGQASVPDPEIKALAVQKDHSVPAFNRKPAHPPGLAAPRRKQKSAEMSVLWIPAIAVLSGAAAAGVIRALCSAFQLEWMNAYLNLWLSSFTAPDTHALNLFAAEYFTLAGAATFLLLSGFSAFGPVMISFFLMLYGTGSGLLMLQLLDGASLTEKLLVVLFTAFPSAVATGCLCLLASAAMCVSGRIREYSFRKNIPVQDRPDTGVLVRQYAFVLVLIVPLCGAAAGMACIENRFF